MTDPDFKDRRSDRQTVQRSAELRAAGLYAVEVTVCNVSPCGFMAECAEPVLIGSNVTLDIPGIGPVPAQVRWQIGNRMGGMFRDPISMKQCEWTAIKAEASEAA